MTPAARGWRPSRFALGVAAITLVAALLRWYGLSGAPPLGDDLSVGASAVNLVERGSIGPTMWQHPRVRDLLVYGSLLALGSSKVGLVLPSLALGLLTVPLLALLGRRIGGPEIGLVAAALAAVDPLLVAYSRQAIQEVYTAFFGLAGLLLVARHLSTGRRVPLVAAGLLFGLGLGAKWSVGFPLAVSLAWLVGSAGLDRATPAAERATRIAFAVAALGALPVAVYAATWTPWFLAGNDLADFVDLHRLLAAEVASHGGFNRATLEMPHRPALWFLFPVWYADFTIGPHGPVPYLTITNPAVWLLVLPAAAVAARSAWRERNAGLGLVTAAFGATYAPFLLASRPIWVHSALVVLPFALVLVAALAWRLARRTSRPDLAIGAYLAAVALVATPLYAVAVGHGLRSPLLRPLVEATRPAFESGAR